MPEWLTDVKVVAAIVGLISFVFGSILTTFFAPWVKWKLDKRNEKQQREIEDKDRKRKLIKDSRKMLINSHRNAQGIAHRSVEDFIQTHSCFLELEPHLSQKAKSSVYRENRTYTVGAEMQGCLLKLKDDIIRLERKWDL